MKKNKKQRVEGALKRLIVNYNGAINRVNNKLNDEDNLHQGLDYLYDKKYFANYFDIQCSMRYLRQQLRDIVSLAEKYNIILSHKKDNEFCIKFIELRGTSKDPDVECIYNGISNELYYSEVPYYNEFSKTVRTCLLIQNIDVNNLIDNKFLLYDIS